MKASAGSSDRMPHIVIMATTFLLLLIAFGTHQAFAQTNADLRVYGPGGPAPAMKEAAKAFEQKTGTAVVVTAGPTPEWIEQAKSDADLIYSGSETMMTDFAQALEAQIDETRVEPLYLRPFSILVRPGNPKNIKGLRDLFRPGYRVMVVNGAGQNGVWEDAAGRQGDIKSVRALRKNIVKYAKNSALAKQAWIDDQSLDAWLIWNIWQVANPALADIVPVEKDYVIYRDTGIVVTKKGDSSPAAKQFMDFLKSPDGAAIYRKWGWMTSMDSMQKMQMSGDTDKDFAMMMQMHHQHGVEMAQMELAHGKSPAMKAMARQIIEAQKKELAQLEQWLAKQK